MNVDYVFKLIIVGDSMSGKSSLLNKSCNNKYNTFYEATIGVDFIVKINKMIDGTLIKSHIWDTAGQKCFSSIIRNYYKGTAGIIYVFDKSNRRSFDNIKFWLNEVYESGVDNIPSMLIANKVDKVSKVSSCEASNYASKEGMIYMETSAKKGINTNEFLDIFIKNIYNNMDEYSDGIKKITEYKKNIDDEDNKDENCCCAIC